MHQIAPFPSQCIPYTAILLYCCRCSDFLVPATDLVTGSPPDLAGKATDLAGSAQASIGDSFGYINHAWSSVINSVTSTKDQVKREPCFPVV